MKANAFSDTDKITEVITNFIQDKLTEVINHFIQEMLKGIIWEEEN